MKRRLLFPSLFAAAVLGLSACHKTATSTAGFIPLSSKLDGQIRDQKNREAGTIEYIVNFTSRNEADEHRTQVQALGGIASSLGNDQTTLVIRISKGSLKKLDVPTSSLATLNRAVTMSARPERDENPDLEALAQEVLTTKSVVGVTELQQRFPRALGAGLKVAVFDTGIDFGVEGLSESLQGRSRLTDFYDMTGFGKVTAQALANSTPQPTYEIGGMTVRLDNIGAQSISATGVLSEEAVARAYYMPDGIDFNGNDAFNDVFPFLVGVNQDGNPALWIDLNKDGAIASRTIRDEELTDYNTTHKHLDVRNAAALAGSKPIAVTLTSSTDVQFHAIPGGHGTSCAIIIAGNGYGDRRLTGMVPQADLVSFVLDTSGQDVYSLSEFLAMFLKARDLGVSGISISWGFATGDLASARFVADFLDREITSRGIVIGIAAGNEGPGINSAAPDDYVPRHGFGLGAMISKVQAENVYGWTGTPGDSMVWYSSFGPTAGGRQMPDIASPIVTLVRGERAGGAAPFYGFSGTSSATPAFVGASIALVSALKSQGITEVNTRLLKLALQNSATPLADIPYLRQGAGVVNVNAAYDIYVRILREYKAAAGDLTRRTPFPYEVLASVPLEGRTGSGEGIHIRGPFTTPRTVNLRLSNESLGLIDPTVFFAPLALDHDRDFFAAPQMVNLQSNGANFTVAFDATKLLPGGSYIDSIRLKRVSDGLVLATIPVVVEVPATPQNRNVVSSADTRLGPFDLWRQSITLSQSSGLRFDGFATELQGDNGSLGLVVRAPDGHTVHSAVIPLTAGFNAIQTEVAQLPAGSYELVAYRNFRRPAVLGDIDFHLVVRATAGSAEGVTLAGDTLNAVVRGVDTIAPAKAVLKVQNRTYSSDLTWNDQLPRPGFAGGLELEESTPTIKIGLRQTAFARATKRLLHMEFSAIDRDDNTATLRSWIDVEDSGMPLRGQDLSHEGKAFAFIAYPNILQPGAISNGETLRVLAEVPLRQATSVVLNLPTGTRLSPNQLLPLSFSLAGMPEAQGGRRYSGVIELQSNAGQVLGTWPLSF